MITGSINSIESFSTIDGPGIRCTVFLNKCLLRCKYCHNPEMWNKQPDNYSTGELVDKVKRYKPYFANNGGVTLSGGEPLLQRNFVYNLCQELKKENIHIALDTAGYTPFDYIDIINSVDLIIYDIKDITPKRYKELTGGNIEITWKFLESIKKLEKKVWVRQVVVPGIHDNEQYINELIKYIQKHFDISKIEKIEFLPYHKLGDEKYSKLKIDNPYSKIKPMDEKKCNELFEIFEKKFKKLENGEK